MKILAAIIISLSFVNNLEAKPKLINGIVISDLGEKLHSVTISIKGTDTSTLSDCKGKFQISAEKGDTLIASKNGYLIGKAKVHGHGKHKISLVFDYAGFKEKIEQDSSFDKSIYLGASQPLFIVDGFPPQNSYYLAISEHALEEDFLPVIVWKGKEATDLFGPCARNGAIWLRTKCGLFNADGTRAHLIEPQQ